ncbi:MAG TPA: AsmA-like C-terminal domain-containing protein, partial [Aliarcobacter thereius]
ENRKFIYIEDDETKFTYSENDKKYFDIYLSKASSKFVNNLSNKEAIDGGYLDFYANGTMKNLKGQLFIKDTKVKELSTINNILFFIQTSPALINPLFAIPAVLNIDDIGHYEIEKGSIKLLYSDNMNVLYLNDINLIGNGMDLEGNAYVNLNNNNIYADLNLIFMKTYTNVVNVLPIVNYILLGENRRVDSRIKVSGDLKDPKIESNLLGDSLSAPVNILKRTITAPIDIFNNFIKNSSEDN